MELFIQISQFVLAISILVILHEFGHFLPARWFGIKVEKFFLFFDVKFALFKKKIGDTVYGVGWLPLGGYVKIAGMIDESMDKEQMAQPPQPWEFRSKPAWKRLIVMVGGVTVNVLLAWFIYTAMLAYYGDVYIPANKLRNGIEVNAEGEALGFKNGDQILEIDGKPVKRFDKWLRMNIVLGDDAKVLRDGKEISFVLDDLGKKEVLKNESGTPFISAANSSYIGYVEAGSVAEKMGLEAGSEILSINGTSIESWSDVLVNISKAKGDSINLVYIKEGTTRNVNGFLAKEKSLGVKSEIVVDEYTVFEAIPAGWTTMTSTLVNQIRQFKLIFNRKTEGYKQVKGPIGIVEMMSPTWDWERFWDFTAMFSVWLAFVNILPIPALDGGHVMFLLYEMISGRKPSEKTLERGQIIGFIIVMGLMLVIFGNDIWNLFK